MISKSDMLEVADHLERRADDAYMKHDDVVMTPREVHALAMDIKSFALELGRETCRIVEDERGHSACSRCGADYLCMCEAEFCPSCGAKVVR